MSIAEDPRHPQVTGSGLPDTAGQTKISLVLVVYLVALFTPMAFSLGPLAMNPLRLFLLFATPVLLINLLTGKYGRICATDILFILHILWVTVSLAVNNPSMVVQTSGSTSMEFLGGYLVARAAVRDRASFASFCRVLGLVICFSLIPALIEVATGRAIIMALFDALPGVRSIGDGSNTRMGIERVQVVFQHPILYGLVCSTGLSLTFVAMRDEMGHFARYVRAGMISVATFLSLSSGTLLAMLLHYFMNGWAWVLRWTKARWLILGILSVVAYVAVDHLSTRSPMRVFLTYATFSAQTAFNRLYIFEWGMVNIRDNPLFGIGFNDWVRPPHMGSSVDNFWLLTTMRHGIPAFALLAGGYLLLLFRVGLRDFDADPRLFRYRRAWCFTAAGLGFTLTTVHVWSGPYSFMAFIVGAGIWFLYAVPDNGQSPSPDAEPGPQSPRTRRQPVYTRMPVHPGRRVQGRKTM